MTTPSGIWKPRFEITPRMTRGLMRIEAARTLAEHTDLSPVAAEALCHRARLRSTHHSTRIEGNRLTLEETAQVIERQSNRLQGKERDVREVQNYWNALLRVEEWAEQKKPLTHDLIRRLHALVEHGAKAKPTPYRDGQNVIWDSGTGRIIYMPPMAQDVPALIEAFIAWTEQAESEGLPAPLIAGLAHYQFATVHPYYDGNGRTARLLATFLLHRGGYGLNGIFSLEEIYSRDLPAYYQALATHPHHNYYEGRETADLTLWLNYFVATLERVFVLAEEETLRTAQEGFPVEPDLLRRLDMRSKRVLSLFGASELITTRQTAALLGISERATRAVLAAMVAQGVLEVAAPSNRARAYRLSEVYRNLIGGLSEANDYRGAEF